EKVCHPLAAPFVSMRVHFATNHLDAVRQRAEAILECVNILWFWFPRFCPREKTSMCLVDVLLNFSRERWVDLTSLAIRASKRAQIALELAKKASLLAHAFAEGG